MTAKCALFLDRDGVLIELVQHSGKFTAPWNRDEFKIITDALPLVAAAQQIGAEIIVVTNQPDIEDKLLAMNDLLWMHEQIKQYFSISIFEFCPSHDNAHPRRKPNPGMILDAAQAYGINLERSLIVGDTWRDIEAGKRAGIKTLHLNTSVVPSNRLQVCGCNADWEAGTHSEAAEIVRSFLLP